MPSQRNVFTHVFPDGEVVQWTGRSRALCSTCRNVFNSVHAFDAHRVDSRCDLDRVEYNPSTGYWVSGLMPEIERKK